MAVSDITASGQEYEDKLGDALEQLLGNGADDLQALSVGLHSLGLTLPDGSSWTEESLKAELSRLAGASR